MRTTLSLLFCGLAATAVRAQVPSPPACPSDQTVQYYEDNFPTTGVSCSNGVLSFSNFNFQLYSASGPGTILPPSDIDLTATGILDQAGITGFAATGLNGSQISVAPGQDVTYVLDWFFLIDSGATAASASLSAPSASGDITITQYYCLDSIFEGNTYNGSAPVCSPSVEGTDPSVQTLSITTDIPNALTDSSTFGPAAHDFADVMTVIQLIGSENGSAVVSVNAESQIKPSTPEPDALLLVPIGLIAVWFLRKRAAIV